MSQKTCYRWSWVVWSLCLFAVPSAWGVDGQPVWQQSVVAGPTVDEFVSSPSLAFNHLGMPSVAWSSVGVFTGTGTVYRSEMSNLGLWAHRQVAAGIGVGTATALTFDRTERPIVTWTKNWLEVYADFNDGQVVQMVASDAGVDSQALSISHDLAGNLRGVYGGNAGTDLKSIGFSGSTFSSLSLTSFPTVDHIVDAQLATDHTGLRHVIARTQLSDGTASVSVASEPSFGGTWPTATLTNAEGVGGVSIATNPATGRIGIAYTTQNAGLSQLVFAEVDGFALQSTVLRQTSTSVYQDVSLAYDRTDGRPAIAFEEDILAGGEALQFAYRDGADAWQTSLIDDSISIDVDDAVRKPSLAFDDYATSYPAVAYVDDDGALTVAFDPPAAPEPAALAPLCLAALFLRRRR